VVAELTENIGGWERITSALDEIRVCHEENPAFFSGVFDQLDSLCGSLLSREQQVEKRGAERRESISAPDAIENNRWDSLLKKLEEDRAEIRGEQQSVQQQIVRLAAAAEDLTAARSEFQAVRGELARQGEELTAVRSRTLAASQEVEESIKNKIRDVEQQQSLLEKERAAMEKGLESVGNRAAEIAELLAEQKRLSDTQQNHWEEDLRQMRTLLEGLTRQIAERRRQAESSPAVKPTSGVAAAASGDPVLDSVLAQFELLQQDRLFRRSETAEQTNKQLMSGNTP
jgi:chromosome segregation ATPase